MSLKIGPPFMDDEVSCEVPDCDQEKNHLATSGTAMENNGEGGGALDRYEILLTGSRDKILPALQ